MPRVQVYKRQVETAAIPGAKLTAAPTADTFGSSGGDKITAIGQQLYSDELLKQDQVATLEADRKLSEWEQRRLYDPKEGALTRRGKDAFGLPDQVSQDFDKTLGEIRGSLTTERQRVAFDRQAETRRRDINGTLTRHVFAEVRKHDDAETENYLLTSRQAAIKAASTGDLARVGTEIDRQVNGVVQHASRHGLGVEYVKQKTTQIKSDTHVGVVEALLAGGNDRLAAEYVSKVRAEIAGDDVATVDKWLQAGTLVGESQRQADRILADSGGTREAAMTAAGKITDPKLRDAVEDRVTRYFSIRKQAEHEQREQDMIGAANIIDRTGSVDRIPPSVWTRLSPGERSSLEAYAKRKEGGGEVKTEWETYYSLMTLGSADATREAFARTNLLAYKHKLGPTEFKQLTELQTSIRKGDGKDAEKLDGYRTNTQIVDDTLRSIKVNPGEKDNGPQVAQFRRAVDEAVAAAERRKGKKLDNNEVQSIADDLVIQGKVPGTGWIWDDTKRAFQLKPGEAIVVKISDVPRGERAKIEAALQALGKPVTDKAITDAYALKLQRMRGQ